MVAILVALNLALKGIPIAVIDENLSTLWNTKNCIYGESSRSAQIRIPRKVRIWYAGMIETRCHQKDSKLSPLLLAFAHLEIIRLKAPLRISWSWTAKSQELRMPDSIAVVDHGTFQDREERFFIEYRRTWLDISQGFPTLTLALRCGDSEDSLIREIGRDGKSL